jgi:hypothetical protein
MASRMRFSAAAAAVAAAAVLCSGCTVFDTLTDSDGVQNSPAVQDANASGRKDHGAASRGKVGKKALESSKAAKQSKAKADKEAADKTAESKGAAAETKAPEPFVDEDEQAALKNTAVSDAELAAQASGNDGGEKEKDGEKAPDYPTLPPVDPETAQQISDLPDYATASGRQTCPASLGSSAQSAAAELAKVLAGKLNIDKGAVFCAPTVIPDEYSDCISDVSSTVASGLAASGKFNMADSGSVQVAQNNGSSMLIPAYVRECRSSKIPYLAVTVVRKVGGKVSLTLRIIRTDTGVTLTQSYRRL